MGCRPGVTAVDSDSDNMSGIDLPTNAEDGKTGIVSATLINADTDGDETQCSN